MIQIFIYEGQKRISAGEFNEMPAMILESTLTKIFNKLKGRVDLWATVSKDDSELRFTFDGKKAKLI